MRHILTFALLFAFQIISAQSERWEYCTVNMLQQPFNSETKASVDYGNRLVSNLKKGIMLTDSTGSEDFKSAVAIFNLLGDQGWEYVEAIMSNQGRIQIALFKRRRLK